MSGTVETKREQVRRILQLPPSAPGSLQDGAARELEAAITAYLRRATETFDLSKNVEVRDTASDATSALLCHKKTAQATKSPLQEAFLAFRWFFMA